MNGSTRQPIVMPESRLKLLGCVYYGDPFHAAREFTNDNEIGKLWCRFQEISKKYAGLLSKIATDPKIGYEIHFESDQYATTREYCVFVGVEVSLIDEQPPELFAKVLPRTAYVLVTTRGTDHRPVDEVLRTWLPASPHEQAYRFIIERYDARRWRSLDDATSEIDWLIPVRRRDNA